MSDFVPKKADPLGNIELDGEPPQQGFTPMLQQLQSQTETSKDVGKTEFKSKQIEHTTTTNTTKSESLKNIQVPSQSGNSENSVEETELAHKANVKVVRNGDSITQIIVKCRCGETIPLDCIY